MRLRSPALPLLSALLFLLPACGPDSREDWRDALAKSTCTRYDECGRIGKNSDDFYDSYDECLVKLKSSYNDMWPSDRCTDDNINESKAEECVDRAGLRSCGGLIERTLEDASFFSECSASKVCIGN